MSALSAVQTATTLTPPSSSHGDGNGFSWDFTSAKHENRPYHEKTTLKTDTTNGIYRSHHLTRDENGSALDLDTSSKASSGGDQVNGPGGAGAVSRSHSNDDEDDSDDRPDNVVDVPFDDDYQRSGRTQTRSKDHLDLSDEDSKWIHRDLLAKIESQELQAAGITLPQSRSRSRPRRDRSQSSARKPMQDNSSRSRKNSSHAMEPKTPDTSEAINGWASRPIEEAEAEGDAPSKPAGGSRIPVPKKSPLPIPTTHLERDKLMKRENSPEELEKRIEMPKARSRSNSTTLKNLEPSPTFKAHPAKRAATTDLSPKKQTPTGPRKGSAPSKSIPPEARGKVKPKPKNGAANSNARPSTRSGERELSMGSKPMEGDPPWLVSAYKPDPRLPPDQQLLPTVARRLQQEKWEQEGKFGSIYDKDFRPLTGEGFLVPRENIPSSSSDEIVKQEVEKPADDWPLKSPDIPKSPASPGRSSSYSTMPKIQDKPPASPLSSPKQPSRPVESPEPMQITRVPDIPEKEPEQTGKKEKGGCGCCIVM
ncbi:hypothetical protein INS49_015616 [Diaporthe citri]|uniref:uncharacterized protein n=1 Tax=Diaporthe citri TaxID=83186 RepID=UPI001C7F4C8C|nr:uncharacterized protein INS49_015616 [Diaporthe citri]KAG6356229.1 hypothetical protein INS49_015616 [Diaporthe citri]